MAAPPVRVLWASHLSDFLPQCSSQLSSPAGMRIHCSEVGKVTPWFTRFGRARLPWADLHFLISNVCLPPGGVSVLLMMVKWAEHTVLRLTRHAKDNSSCKTTRQGHMEVKDTGTLLYAFISLLHPVFPKALDGRLHGRWVTEYQGLRTDRTVNWPEKRFGTKEECVTQNC